MNYFWYSHRGFEVELVANHAGIVCISNSEHVRGEAHHLPLEGIPGFFVVNWQGED